MGETPEISEWLDFEFYDLVWWLDNTKQHPFEKRRLAQWLGISHHVGSDLCYWLITESGKLISKTSVEHVVQADYIEPSKKQQIDTFNKTLDERLDDTNFRLTGDMDISRLYLDDDVDPDQQTNVPTNEKYGDMLFEPRPDEDDEEAVNKYRNMELILDLGNDNE